MILPFQKVSFYYIWLSLSSFSFFFSVKYLIKYDTVIIDEKINGILHCRLITPDIKKLYRKMMINVSKKISPKTNISCINSFLISITSSKVFHVILTHCQGIFFVQSFYVFLKESIGFRVWNDEILITQYSYDCVMITRKGVSQEAFQWSFISVTAKKRENTSKKIRSCYWDEK